MILDEEVYLEHYGVLGMKWGQRKDRKRINREIKRTKRIKSGKLTNAQRVGTAAVGYGAYSIGSMATMKLLGEPSISKLAWSIGAGSVVGVKGGQATADYFRRNNNKKLRELRV